MDTLFRDVMDTPLGPLHILCAPDGLRALFFGIEEPSGELEDASLNPKLCAKARRQLEEYFAGRRKAFSLPLSLKLTPFQKAVFHALCDVPYGETVSYGELAGRIGRPRAARAVGQALRRNPVPIVIPCHRVLGADGSLTGYAGPSHTSYKAWLLEHEKRTR